MLRLITIVFGLGYPAIAYSVLHHFGPRGLGVLVCLVFAPCILFRVIRHGWGEFNTSSVQGMMMVVALALGSMSMNRVDWLLLTPVVFNLCLAIGFGLTLRLGPSMIERFARLQEPDLSVAKQSWCRMWTMIWVGYFVTNCIVVSYLAYFAPVSWWATYTGAIAYIIMGSLFAVEFVGRTLKFGQARWHQRLRLLFGTDAL